MIAINIEAFQPLAQFNARMEALGEFNMAILFDFSLKKKLKNAQPFIE
jgi:hypothetical protein